MFPRSRASSMLEDYEQKSSFGNGAFVKFDRFVVFNQ